MGDDSNQDRDEEGRESQRNRHIDQLALAASLNTFIQIHLNVTTLALQLPAKLDIAIIAQLQNLQELLSDFDPNLRDDVLWASWQPLNNLSKLRKFEIANLPAHSHSELANFLRESASTETLKHLSIELGTIDESSIDGLTRFHHLHQLTMRLANVMDIPEVFWRQLRQLNCLIDLHLPHVNSGVSKHFLQALPATHHALQLQSLFLCGNIDEERIANLGHFEPLKKLKLQMFLDNENSLINWQPLQRLTQLKRLHLSCGFRDGTVLPNLLNNSGSSNTLEELEISDPFAANLKRLKLNSSS